MPTRGHGHGLRVFEFRLNRRVFFGRRLSDSFTNRGKTRREGDSHLLWLCGGGSPASGPWLGLHVLSVFGALNVLLRFTFQVRPHLRPIQWHVALEQVSEASASQIPPGFEFTVERVSCRRRTLRVHDPRSYAVESPRLVVAADLLGGVGSQQPRSAFRKLVTRLASVADLQRDGDIAHRGEGDSHLLWLCGEALRRLDLGWAYTYCRCLARSTYSSALRSRYGLTCAQSTGIVALEQVSEASAS